MTQLLVTWPIFHHGCVYCKQQGIQPAELYGLFLKDNDSFRVRLKSHKIINSETRHRLFNRCCSPEGEPTSSVGHQVVGWVE